MNSQKLLALGTIIADNQVAIALGTPVEAATARHIIAGALAAAQALLSPAQFGTLTLQCEINPVDLAEMIELATTSHLPEPNQRNLRHLWPEDPIEA